MVAPLLRSAALVLALVVAALPVCTGWSGASGAGHACCADAEPLCAERLVEACCAGSDQPQLGEIAPGTLLMAPATSRAAGPEWRPPIGAPRPLDAQPAAPRLDVYLLFSVLLV